LDLRPIVPKIGILVAKRGEAGGWYRVGAASRSQAGALGSTCYTRLANPIAGFGHYLNRTMFCALQSDRSNGRYRRSPDNVVRLPTGHSAEASLACSHVAHSS
jgi:hypothetical protein